MLTVDRRQSIPRQFRATRDRQGYRARLVEMHNKTGRHRRSTWQFSAITDSRWSIKTRWRGKKCSLAMIGRVSAPTSRIQDEVLVDTLLQALTHSEGAAELAENWTRIAEHFDTLFTTEASIDKLKQAVLQLAVMGRLVPQDPNEEPVSALHDQILTERNRLIKTEGMRTKASEKIRSKEHYIPTPKHWVWVRLGNTAKFIDYRGKTPKKVGYGRRLITAKNIRFGFIDKNPEEFISESGYVDWMTRGFPRVGDTLFTPEAPLGNAANVDIEEGFALAQRAICFQWHIPETAKFMLMQVLSQFFQKQLSLNATGMTATGIKASKLKEIPITLPPLEEQHRIVEKVDELMALCDRLKAHLGEAGETRTQLAEAVVEQAVSQAGRNDHASPLFR